jgi:hypothetical protein
MCIVLGMGLPTTANYIVVASVMAGPLVTLAGQNGIEIPLIAVHLFVFYFGLISGTTPPVAVDAYAGAAVAGSNPVTTCLYAFFYNLRTSLLPFFFVFNSHLLLIGFNHWWEVVVSLTTAVVAMIAFASGTQNFFLVKNRIRESVAMLLIAFSLIRPGYWLDKVQEPFTPVAMETLGEALSIIPEEKAVRFKFKGENFAGEEVERYLMLSLGTQGADGMTRLEESSGMILVQENGKFLVEDIMFGSKAQRTGVDFGWEVLWAKVETDRMAKQWFYLPALCLLWVIWLLQRNRLRRKEQVDVSGNVQATV